eukprot:3627064-Rhodomonas_salina.4
MGACLTSRGAGGSRELRSVAFLKCGRQIRRSGDRAKGHRGKRKAHSSRPSCQRTERIDEKREQKDAVYLSISPLLPCIARGCHLQPQDRRKTIPSECTTMPP